MQKYLRHILFFAVVFCSQFSVFSLKAQTLFIPSGGGVFLYPADSVGIFSNVLNKGNFGTMPGAIVNFLGNHWENTSLALLPGASGSSTPGGLFRFIGKQKQYLATGYHFHTGTGPSFPNLSIANRKGIWLEDLNDLHVRGDLHFESGYLYLNGWNALVNDSITGYSEENFVVTGGGIGGGSLYRKSPPLDDSLVIFPIGTAAGSYSPVGIKASRPFSGIVGATVFDHVYQHAINGNIIDSNHVWKTWQLNYIQGIPQTKIRLQHNKAAEDPHFTPYRDSSYVSLYSLTDNKWDMDPLPHNVYTPGALTTGNPQSNTFVNDRIFMGGIPAETSDSVSWFGISITGKNNTCPVANFKIWTAQRQNYHWVQLFWRTVLEMNIDSFQIQRRRDTASVFKTIATIDSKSIDGFSDHLLYYYYPDENTYDGWTYYRLKMISAGNCIVYTDLQKVPSGVGIEVWPNPTRGKTQVHITGIRHPVIMQLVDTWGQILYNYKIDKNGIFDVRLLSDAMYFLVFRDPQNGGKKITTIKLVVRQAK